MTTRSAITLTLLSIATGALLDALPEQAPWEGLVAAIAIGLGFIIGRRDDR